MKNPTLSFRLSPYQLTKALRAIRQFNPTYQPESLNMLIKDIVIEYITKFDLSDDVTITQMDEITLLIPSKFLTSKKKEEKITLDTILNKENQQSMEKTPAETSSTITTVTDFSPPTNWDNLTD